MGRPGIFLCGLCLCPGVGYLQESTSMIVEMLVFFFGIVGMGFVGIVVGRYLGMKKAIKMGREWGYSIRGRTLTAQYNNLIGDLEK